MNRKLVLAFLLAAAAGVGFSASGELREDELSPVTFREWQTAKCKIDFRPVISVLKLTDEPALADLTYSALAWKPDVAATKRTAKVTAQAGMLTEGVFTPDGSATLTLLPSTAGEGSFTWQPTSVEKKVYQLTHAAYYNGTPDADGIRYSYFDFTRCDIRATQAAVEAAVLGVTTHAIAVVQDTNHPWQPLQEGVAGAGVATDETLAENTETTTAFSFRGVGTLHYEYALDGGTLAVVADGETVATYTAPVADWQARSIAFTDYVAHTVSFVYTAPGGSKTASLRGVRWVEDAAPHTSERMGGIRVDLREGVRVLRYTTDVLPFTYSSTNWIGVTGAKASSVARVSIVELTGTDPCVTNWTEEVAGTARVLAETTGEGAVVWKAKQGVWKATFDILTNGSRVYQEFAYFDLRTMHIPGLVIMIR